MVLAVLLSPALFPLRVIVRGSLGLCARGFRQVPSAYAEALSYRIQSRLELMLHGRRGGLLAGLKKDARTWLKGLQVPVPPHWGPVVLATPPSLSPSLRTKPRSHNARYAPSNLFSSPTQTWLSTSALAASAQVMGVRDLKLDVRFKGDLVATKDSHHSVVISNTKTGPVLYFSGKHAALAACAPSSHHSVFAGVLATALRAVVCHDTAVVCVMALGTPSYLGL